MTPFGSARLLEALASKVEHARGLDRVAAPVHAWATKLTSAPAVTTVLSGTTLGHPAHPLLVAVPIGSWTGSLLLDLLHQPAAARALVGLGVVSALPTAVTGLNDWRDTVGAEQRVGLVHAALNWTAIAMYAASWLARRRGNNTVGVVLSASGLAVLAGAGWLGGHLSYALGVGVDTTAFQTDVPDWTDAGPAEAVRAGALRKVEVTGGVAILLTRVDDAVVAMADRCTHRGGPLDEGTIVDGCVRCPWHHSDFRLRDGSVAHGPATRPQAFFQVRVVDDRIQVRRREERTLRTNPIGS